MKEVGVTPGNFDLSRFEKTSPQTPILNVWGLYFKGQKIYG
jgi:hypothetical protein